MNSIGLTEISLLGYECVKHKIKLEYIDSFKDIDGNINLSFRCSECGCQYVIDSER